MDENTDLYTILIEKSKWMRSKGTELKLNRSEFDADEAWELLSKSERIISEAPAKDFPIIESILYQQFLIGHQFK